MRTNFFPESIRFGREMNQILEQGILSRIFNGVFVVQRRENATRSELVRALTPHNLGRVEQSDTMFRLPGLPADYVIDTFTAYMFLRRADTKKERAYCLNSERLI